jgi:hypothetical protein
VKTVRNPETEKDSLPRCKRLAGDMWSGHLVCSKLDELVEPNPGAGTWEEFPNMNVNVEVSDNNI